MVDQRRREISDLIDEVLEYNFLKDRFGFDSQIDKDKLIMAGHSFGGTTQIMVANTDERVKAVVLMDCWFFPIHHHIDKGQLKNYKRPIMFNYSEFYHEISDKIDFP
jgi:pimeloyl-ACP methyl ester carboxylesterase